MLLPSTSGTGGEKRTHASDQVFAVPISCLPCCSVRIFMTQISTVPFFVRPTFTPPTSGGLTFAEQFWWEQICAKQTSLMPT